AELGEMTKHLDSVLEDLECHKVVIREYENVEKELRSQAQGVKQSLENTLHDRDLLVDRIEQRKTLEYENVKQWNEEQSHLSRLWRETKKELETLTRVQKGYVEKTFVTISKLQSQCQVRYLSFFVVVVVSLKEETGAMKESCEKDMMVPLKQVSVTTNEWFQNSHCKQLNQWKESVKNINADHLQHSNQLKVEMIPQLFAKISQQMSDIQTQVCFWLVFYFISFRVENKYVYLSTVSTTMMDCLQSHNKSCNQLGQHLYSALNEVNDQMESQKKANNNLMKEWKEKFQANAKQNYEQTIQTISDALENTWTLQSNQFNDQIKQLESTNKQISKYTNLKALDKNNNELCQTTLGMKKTLDQDLSEYTNQSNKDEAQMKQLFQTMEEGHKSLLDNANSKWKVEFLEWETKQSDQIDNAMKTTILCLDNEMDAVKKFAGKHEDHCNKIISMHDQMQQQFCLTNESISEQANNIALQKTQLEELEKHTNQSKPNVYVDNALDRITTFRLQQYQRSHLTPYKSEVIYPSKFVERQPFSELYSKIQNQRQVGKQDHNPSQASSDINNQLPKCSVRNIFYTYLFSFGKLNLSLFYTNEISIDFNENEMGLRIYSGNNGINAFVKHCLGDNRVQEHAQIIQIDGIDVVDKSFNHIRTLLATKQRPVNIIFRNSIGAPTNGQKTSPALDVIGTVLVVGEKQRLFTFNDENLSPPRDNKIETETAACKSALRGKSRIASKPSTFVSEK
ncbi:hypothetical protein RFI_25894, partial [Reticulomyxa filosa]